MSLLEFPPPNIDGRPYALQEFNGRIITGNQKELKAMIKCSYLSDLPLIERSHLNSLQHCISKNNLGHNVVLREENNVKQAWSKWNQEGISGVVEHVASIAEPTRMWPIAKLGRGVVRMGSSVASAASKMMMFNNKEKAEDLLEQYAECLHWKSNWLRCIAIHDECRRLAVCQMNNYIRVYSLGPGSSKTPLTLKHADQTNVAAMSWDPFDQRILAVAAGSKVLIWRLSTTVANIKPSAQCAQVIEMNSSPINQIVWDKTSSSGLIASSPDSNKLMMVNTIDGDIDTYGAWLSGNITRLVLTNDGQRIAVLYTTNMIRVYHRVTWKEENWTLPGRATSAVWSASGDFLLFATEKKPCIYAIQFTSKRATTQDGQTDTIWKGDEKQKLIFNTEAIEFDSSEAETRGAVDRPIMAIGGIVWNMALSPDSQRLAVSFRDNPSVVCLFIVDWNPTVRLTPSGFIEAPTMGDAALIQFLPKFDHGSLLSVVWSSGSVQYIPLIYGANLSVLVNSKAILDDVNVSLNDSKALSIQDSKSHPVENLENESDAANSSIVLFSEGIRSP